MGQTKDAYEIDERCVGMMKGEGHNETTLSTVISAYDFGWQDVNDRVAGYRFAYRSQIGD